MVYLYEFKHYDGGHGGTLLARWTATSYAAPVVYGGLNYAPLEGLTHSSLRYDSEQTSGQLTLTVPRDYAVAQKFLAGYPYGSIHIRITEIDTGVPYVVYIGRVRSCDFSELTAALTCTNGAETLARLGLRYNGGQQCQHALYGPDCGVSAAANKQNGTVSSVSADGVVISVSGVSGTQMGGKLIALGQARMIVSNNGGNIRLFSNIPGLGPGTPCVVYRGCDKTTSATYGCRSFNNIAKFSGFENFPTPKNVFAEGAA